ncbi:MAG: hypothetical protein E7316_02835 [Clostridiales bacterium]|nr:hypothetical protein [Clostridiales bacterium]
MDRFLEEVVVKKQRGLNEVLYMLAVVFMIFLAIFGFMLLQSLFSYFNLVSLILTALCLGGALLLYLYRDRLRAEYEYTFTNGALDFAMVFNNQKRKSLGSLTVSRVEAFGKVSGKAFQRYTTMKDVKISNWFLNRGAELYYFYIQKESAKRIIVFEPSEDMVAYIKFYLPHGAWQE